MTDGMEIDNGLLGDDHNTSMMLGNDIVMRKRYTSTHLEKNSFSIYVEKSRGAIFLSIVM